MNDARGDTLTAGLRALPEPAPPATLEATVMARSARLPVPAPDRAPGALVDPARSRRDVASWAWAAAGLLMVLGLGAYRQLFDAALPGLAAPGFASSAVEMMPADPLMLSVLVLGLWLYTAGLFAQVGRGRRPDSGS
jgi:hypothetical protein